MSALSSVLTRSLGPSKWERVTHERDVERTERLEVPGGWLYRTIAYGIDGLPSVAMTFVEEK